MGVAHVVIENDLTKVGSAVSGADCNDVLERLCCIKPLGPGVTVTARDAPEGNVVFRVHICGTEPDPSDSATGSASADECRSTVCLPFA